MTTPDFSTLAAAIGTEHGNNAATWVDILSDNAQMILDGIKACDPLVMDSLPGSDLSGEWADGYTSDQLMSDVGAPTYLSTVSDDFTYEEIITAYEDAFAAAVEQSITARCESIIREAVVWSLPST